MTLFELKSEIQKTLEHVPENVLQDVYDFLKEAEKAGTDNAALSVRLSHIINEDKQLLQKLAQ